MALPNIEATVIAHHLQRYPTVGDWIVGEGGARKYRVSNMDNPDYEFLVLIHEMIEHHFCERSGVTQEMVDAFDKQFEEERAEGKHPADSEPGDDPTAPYYAAHNKALHLERQLCQHLGLDWDVYEAKLASMP